MDRQSGRRLLLELCLKHEMRTLCVFDTTCDSGILCDSLDLHLIVSKHMNLKAHPPAAVLWSSACRLWIAVASVICDRRIDCLAVGFLYNQTVSAFIVVAMLLTT